MHRYFKTNDNTSHIEHYILNCSIGDWFVLYQMSRNLNRKFFADFLTVLSKRVNPDPETECDETPFINKWDMLKVVHAIQNVFYIFFLRTLSRKPQMMILIVTTRRLKLKLVVGIVSLAFRSIFRLY